MGNIDSNLEVIESTFGLACHIDNNQFSHATNIRCPHDGLD